MQLAQAAAGGVWSPNGRMIAFANRNNGNALEVYDLVEDEQISVRTSLVRSVKLGFCWSPDSRWLAFSGDRRDGRGVIARVKVSGQLGETEELLSSVSPDRLSWHPDGSKLVYSEQKKDRHRLFTIDATSPNSSPTEVTGIPMTLSAAVPTWSPDGKRIVIVALPAK
ncbi:MAG: PD40 domain-containing protein [Planctomycetes bacterium]|nr:PD40 domain-containing protein [Planctomycetota bacterium]